MHKCVVCRNSSSNTRYTRPDVIYHAFPKNEYRRKKWLKIYAIDRCYDWHRICSDHFLEENYKPGAKRVLKKNTIPQPYNKNCDESGFPSNYTSITQSNDVEMGNNEFLPTEQNRLSYTNQSNDVETSTNEFLPTEQNHLSYTNQSNDVETSTNDFLPTEQNHLSYTNQSNDVETSTNDFLATEQNHLSYTNQSNDVETSTNDFLATKQNHLSYTNQSNDVETSTDEFLPAEQNHLSYTNQSNDVETSTDEFLPAEQNHLSYTNQSNDVETSTNEFLPAEQNHLSYTNQSNDVETSTNEFLPAEQNHLSYTNQSNDVETRTNDFLATEQNHLRKLAHYGENDYIESEFYRSVQNVAIKNVESLRRSCRKIKLTTTNEDMSYENMPRLQTERFERQVPTFIANENIQTVSDRVVVPVLTTTKDHTLGNGPRCSVKNCFNRYSKDLSFFGYPSDFTLRKKWIEKCGLQVDPTKKIKSGVRVCRIHFEDDCFMNPERKNRLRPDAIPSLFLDDDVIDARNIPSTSSAVNNGFIRVNKPSPVKSGSFRVNKRSTVNKGIRANKPSCSSTNYVANINSTETKLFVYIDSITRSAKDFNSTCSIPGCITNVIDEVEDISLFAPSIETVNLWSSILGLDLTINSIVCERHFRPQDLRHPHLLINDSDFKLNSLADSAKPVPVNSEPESRIFCSIPGCTTNEIDEDENIFFVSPPNGTVNLWSSILGLDLDSDTILCERHFKPQDILHTNSTNGLKGKSLAPFALPVAIMSAVPEPRTYCSIPGCTTNEIDEVEDISFFSPPNRTVNLWSSILRLDLTTDSILCEKHFKPQDILHPNSTNGLKGKSLAPSAKPVPVMNAVHEPRTYCSIPGCTTNEIDEDENISFFSPPNGVVNIWSAILGLDLPTNSILCEKHFKPQDIIHPNSSNSLKRKSLAPFALPVAVMSAVPEPRTYCSIPGCTTNEIDEVEDISFFSPPYRTVNLWSSILRLDLTTDSILCEKHFKPQDILHPNSTNGLKGKSLAPSAKPVPVMNAVHELRTYCSIPGCTTNEIDEDENISFVSPPNGIVNIWSAILGLDLTTNSILCEKHFKPQDIIHPNSSNGLKRKSLAPFALPVAVMSAVPEPRTYCSIPGCTTNEIDEVEDISFFSPPNEDDVDQWRLSLCLDLTIDSILCEKHFNPLDILRPNSSNGLKRKSLAPFALPVAVMSAVPVEKKKCCSVPGCITNNIINEVKDISLFAPNIHCVNKWSSILGLQLTEESTVCERHFRPYDMLAPTVKINGVCQKVISLVPFSLPLPLNAGLSASNSTSFVHQLETNDVPVLRTYNVKVKRPKPDNLLCTKKIKNNVLDKSLATTDEMFSSKNKNKEYSAVTNDTNEYYTTSGLDPTLKSKTVKQVDLSSFKIEPLDDDLQSNLETEPEHTLSTLRTELLEDDDLLPLPPIDDSLSISLKKLKNISANSSLSVTLEPIKNSKLTEPFSKVPAQNSLTITLRPNHNLSSTTNNSYPSVSLTQCLPSTSSTVYNTSQQSLLQYKQKATSTLKMPDKLSSNTVICSEFINDQFIFPKPIPPTTKSNSSASPEIKIPVISKCISLAVNSDTHDSNPDYSTNTQQFIVIDDDDTEDFIEKDNGFIYEISKSVVLPSVFWNSVHDSSRNSTVFYQQDNLYDTVKNINFYNSLLPKIQIYGKKYKYNKPIRTKNELQNLLEKIDSIEKCYGFDLVIHDNCIGYYDKSTEDITSCSVCQEKFQELHKMTESKTKTTKSLEQKISERTAKVLELRENMENNKINPIPTELVTLRPTSLINSMRICRR